MHRSRDRYQRFGNIIGFNLITEMLPLNIYCYMYFTMQQKWHFRLSCFNICPQLFVLKQWKNQSYLCFLNYHCFNQAVMLRTQIPFQAVPCLYHQCSTDAWRSYCSYSLSFAKEGDILPCIISYICNICNMMCNM